MAINVFEGSRRIVKLLLGICFFAVAAGFLSDNPVRIPVYVDVPNVGVTPIPVEELRDCDPPNYRPGSWPIKRTKQGTTYSLRLCFRANNDWEGGKVFVPFVWTDGQTYGDTYTSMNIYSYANKFASEFEADEALETEINGRYWPELFKQVGRAVFVALLACLGLWLCAKIIGWVVRGFFGIPRGKDFKEAEELLHSQPSQGDDGLHQQTGDDK